nr:hypothetical protein [Tanacetum cinerariifolium]
MPAGIGANAHGEVGRGVLVLFWCRCVYRRVSCGEGVVLAGNVVKGYCVGRWSLRLWQFWSSRRTKAMGIEAANNTPWSEDEMDGYRWTATINDAVHVAYQLVGQLIQDKADEQPRVRKEKVKVIEEVVVIIDMNTEGIVISQSHKRRNGRIDADNCWKR